MTRLYLFLLLGGVLLPACGARPPLDTEQTRRNAEDADDDLDRESRRNQDE